MSDTATDEAVSSALNQLANPSEDADSAQQQQSSIPQDESNLEEERSTSPDSPQPTTAEDEIINEVFSFENKDETANTQANPKLEETAAAGEAEEGSEASTLDSVAPPEETFAIVERVATPPEQRDTEEDAAQLQRQCEENEKKEAIALAQQQKEAAAQAEREAKEAAQKEELLVKQAAERERQAKEQERLSTLAAEKAAAAAEKAAAEAARLEKERIEREEKRAAERKVLEEKARAKAEKTAAAQAKKKAEKEKRAAINAAKKPFGEAFKSFFGEINFSKIFSYFLYRFFPFLLGPIFLNFAWCLDENLMGKNMLQASGLLVVNVMIVFSVLNYFKSLKKVGYFPGLLLGIRMLFLVCILIATCKWSSDIKTSVLFIYFFLAATAAYVSTMEQVVDFKVLTISYESYLIDCLGSIVIGGSVLHWKIVSWAARMSAVGKLMPVIGCLQIPIGFFFIYVNHFTPKLAYVSLYYLGILAYSVLAMLFIAITAVFGEDLMDILLLMTSVFAGLILATIYRRQLYNDELSALMKLKMEPATIDALKKSSSV